MAVTDTSGIVQRVIKEMRACGTDSDPSPDEPHTVGAWHVLRWADELSGLVNATPAETRGVSEKLAFVEGCIVTSAKITAWLKREGHHDLAARVRHEEPLEVPDASVPATPAGK